jgi:hypothetical protein
VAASTKAAKVVNSEREEDNILVDKVLKHLLPFSLHLHARTHVGGRNRLSASAKWVT